MSATIDLVLRHGYLALFSYVLVAQLGMPLPSAPLMLAAGTLAAAGRLSVIPAIVAVVAACLCADSLWYVVGRARGASILGLLCRISLEPAACARIAGGGVGRQGARYLLVAKFLPGVGLMVAPIVGHARVPFGRFLALDAAGASLWAGVYVGSGCLMGTMGRSLAAPGLTIDIAALLVVGGLLVAAIAQWVRHRRLRQAPGARRWASNPA
jgi:membrane protein DedA with SNARE-associated domain